MSESGLCRCGCGEATELAPRTITRKGWRKGKPKFYKVNHHRRKSGVPYHIEDRGFETPCWIWQRRIDKKGYGITYRNGLTRFAHREYHQALHGSIPDDYDTHHLCEVKSCVNPEHTTAIKHGEHTRAHNPYRKSTRHIGKKLTLNDARTIRKIREDTGMLYREIAARFGVSKSLVCEIMRGRTWQE